MTTETAHVEVKDRIYYTGDMANVDGWCTVESVGPVDVVLVADDGRRMHVYPNSIGNIYRGHCNPRFVTAKAYLMYRAGLGLTTQS